MSREQILADVRRALTQSHAPHPERPAPPTTATAPPIDLDPVSLFRERLEALGGHYHEGDGAAAVAELIAGLGGADGAVWVANDSAGRWQADAIARAVTAGGRRAVRGLDQGVAADGIAVGVTGAMLAIADTGTVALSAGPGAGRLPGVLPPIHCVVITRDQIVLDLEAAMPRIGDRLGAGLTSGVILVSGPSKTGDIEGRLVVGVHGPGEVHVMLLPEPTTSPS
jgi:L-lactate dehydrogenase complex protein LldG